MGGVNIDKIYIDNIRRKRTILNCQRISMKSKQHVSFLSFLLACLHVAMLHISVYISSSSFSSFFFTPTAVTNLHAHRFGNSIEIFTYYICVSAAKHRMSEYLNFIAESVCVHIGFLLCYTNVIGDIQQGLYRVDMAFTLLVCVDSLLRSHFSSSSSSFSCSVVLVVYSQWVIVHVFAISSDWLTIIQMVFHRFGIGF